MTWNRVMGRSRIRPKRFDGQTNTRRRSHTCRTRREVAVADDDVTFGHGAGGAHRSVDSRDAFYVIGSSRTSCPLMITPIPIS